MGWKVKQYLFILSLYLPYIYYRNFLWQTDMVIRISRICSFIAFWVRTKLKLIWYTNYKPVRYSILSFNLVRRCCKVWMFSSRVQHSRYFFYYLARSHHVDHVATNSHGVCRNLKASSDLLYIIFECKTRYHYIFEEGLPNQFTWSNLFMLVSSI